jgi:hypothetical protein
VSAQLSKTVGALTETPRLNRALSYADGVPEDGMHYPFLIQGRQFINEARR